MPHDEAELRAAKEKHAGWLGQQQGVTGIGIGLDQGGRMCLKIYTDHMPPETRQAISSTLGDVPVEFEETGEFRAL
jgi:hypothetical protein